jgi:hypothetical protein
VLAINAAEKQWLSFNAREDFLHGIRVGTIGDVGRMGTGEATPALVTELLPLGPFATWQAERAVGDYDRNTLRLRLGPQPCVGMRSSSCPKASVHIHDAPTGDALALKMRPTTAPFASTSKSSSFHSPEGRFVDARLRTR